MPSMDGSTKVRERYTSHACIQCQRRKKKCTGEEVCKNCKRSGADCSYARSGSSELRRNLQQFTPVSSSGYWSSAELSRRSEIPSTVWPSSDTVNGDVAARTQMLEQECEALKRELATLRSQTLDTAVIQEPPPPADLSISKECASFPAGDMLDVTLGDTRDNVFERNTKLVAGSSLFRQIDLLDHSVARGLGRPGEHTHTPTEGPEPQSTSYKSLPAALRRDIDTIVEQTKLEDVDTACWALDVYFTKTHPLYPCINETHCRSQFAAFFADDSAYMVKNISIRFAALLNYIMALGKLLYDPWTQDDHIPGWKEFSRGEMLLNQVVLLEKANIITIQILLVKTAYCLYAFRHTTAYDTVGIALRVCLELGLHNEPAWGKNCNFYDRTYRQRIFWCIYCLYHIVSRNTGIPGLIHESDFNVDRPKCVDDRMLYPSCQQLPEMHTVSLVPCLLQSIKWARLSSEIWDAMFGVRGRESIGQEFIAATDEKIMILSEQTPSLLRWPTAFGVQDLGEKPAFVQQRFVLYLRITSLRLLIRREEMINLRYERRTAKLCIKVATDIVNAVELSNSSNLPRQAERYAYTIYLTAAMIPMICIVVRKENDEDLVGPAICLLNRSLKIMEGLSHEWSSARCTLRQLSQPLRVARDIIESNWPQYTYSTFGSGQNPQPGGQHEGIAPTTNLTQNHVSDNVESAIIADLYADPTEADPQRPSEDPVLWQDYSIWNHADPLHWEDYNIWNHITH
jgi:hypothetical protein